MKKVLSVVFVPFIVLAVGLAAEAGPITANDFSNSATLIDFNDPQLLGQTITNQFSSLGVTFSGSNFVFNIGQGNQDLSVSGSLTLNFSSLTGPARVGLDYVANVGQTIYIELYNTSGALIDSVSGTGSGIFSPPLFLGLEVGSDIAYAIIHDGSGQFAVDNIRFESAAPVPEPATALLLSSSIVVGYGVLRRKIRK
jgi:hypothetical protein